MKLGHLFGEIELLLKMWGDPANPEMFAEMPDGTLRPIIGTGCKAGGGKEMVMVFKIGEPT